MPPLAALGAAAISAASAITLTGLATGAAIVSAGTGILSQITGSKTLGKISMGFGIASGAGFLTDGLTSAVSTAKGAKSSVGGKSLLETNNIDDILQAPTKNTKGLTSQKVTGSNDFSKFEPSGAMTSSMDGFNKSSNALEYKPSQTSFDPELEKSFFQRANETLTQFNPLINIAAGVGQGYLQGQQMDLQRELLDKRLNIDQQLIDRTNTNNGTVSNFDTSLNLSRKANPFPLLQRS